MQTLVIASTGKSAGKTCLIAGMARAAGKSFGYLKPFGDRMLYRKKRLWDYDAALMQGLFGMDERAENMSIGFDHAKLRFMYDEEGTKAALAAKVSELGAGKEVLFIEAGGDLKHGASVNLDALSIARFTGGRLIVVAGGEDSEILDDVIFVKKYVDTAGIDLAGVILNKVKDVEDFKTSNLEVINALDIKVFGIVPQTAELSYVTAGFIAERMFAKVLAGENGLHKAVRNIFVGAMSGSVALQHHLFKKECKLVITSGDRSDMILTALEHNASCVVLTNNVLPPSNIISRAAEADIPLIMVPWDTYYTTTFIDNLEPILTVDDKAKIELLSKLVFENIDIKELIG